MPLYETSGENENHPDTEALIWTQIDIRLGYTLSLVRFGGHFGFNVKSEWRGHHYAGKACKC